MRRVFGAIGELLSRLFGERGVDQHEFWTNRAERRAARLLCAYRHRTSLTVAPVCPEVPRPDGSMDSDEIPPRTPKRAIAATAATDKDRSLPGIWTHRNADKHVSAGRSCKKTRYAQKPSWAGEGQIRQQRTWTSRSFAE
jgi:hypothetical protein